jgi:Ca2+-binding EF-hand superfamily protein
MTGTLKDKTFQQNTHNVTLLGKLSGILFLENLEERDMTVPIERALDLLNEKQANINLNDLGFILNVIRDNVSDEEVESILDEFVDKTWDKFQKGKEYHQDLS